MDAISFKTKAAAVALYSIGGSCVQVKVWDQDLKQHDNARLNLEEAFMPPVPCRALEDNSTFKGIMQLTMIMKK